jgi:hypothetical protein
VIVVFGLLSNGHWTSARFSLVRFIACGIETLLTFSLLDLEEEHGKIQEDEANRAQGEPVESEDDTPVYSLVTGELHSVRRFGHRDDKDKVAGSDALVVRNKEEGLVKREGLESVAGKSLDLALLLPLILFVSQPTISRSVSGRDLINLKESKETSGSRVCLKRAEGVLPRAIE